jgi:phthiocerol/phenolphthiocerol synthesis type-I polyketide synthase B
MLADATLRNQTLQRCRQVMGAKVAGAWNVHSAALIAEESLEYLVMFSSTAALLGSPGQANYHYGGSMDH